MVHIYFDAATNQVTGENGLGVWVKATDGTVSTYITKRIGLTSVQAELAALTFALEQAHTFTDESTFMFYSDAETVVRALEQRFLKDQSVRPLFVKALTLYDELPNKFIKWIPRAENRAHDVAKQALLIG
ncbi:reverse transcriptase-like protein [Exiguobacterium sp. TNDT2]|uniref:reverse transcriptase-like protein n=1 Tax=Exiguobacterium sp. TNDT2 TaxID=2233531 RepID=UPI000DEFB84C|nr:reverse transcriptase-like protein [Exiguobacterium sp. TNDT2]